MPTVLIVGASRGIGQAFVDAYAADGWRVHATHRESGPPPTALADIGGDVSLHRLDVRDMAAIEALAGDLAGESLDVLVHNAGIYGPRNDGLGGLDAVAWQEVMLVNSIAPLKLAEAFVDHLGGGERRVMAFLSSAMGSIGDNDSGGAYLYRSSKAALNAGLRSLAIDLRRRAIAVVMLHPGWVQTAMGGAGAPLTPAASVAAMRRLIDGVEPGDSGHFFNYDGSELPW